MAVMSDPDLKRLAEAFAVIAQKEFGHVLRAGESGYAWLMVGTNMVARLQPDRMYVDLGFLIYDDVIEELIGPKEKIDG